MEQEIYMNRELSWLKFNERVLKRQKMNMFLLQNVYHLRQFIKAILMNFLW